MVLASPNHHCEGPVQCLSSCAFMYIGKTRSVRHPLKGQLGQLFGTYSWRPRTKTRGVVLPSWIGKIGI